LARDRRDIGGTGDELVSWGRVALGALLFVWPTRLTTLAKRGRSRVEIDATLRLRDNQFRFVSSTETETANRVANGRCIATQRDRMQ